MSPATVLPPFSRAKASYAQAITDELVEHHRHEWSAEGKELVSAVLFGPLALGEFADTIELLEIVRGFPPSSPGTDPSAFEFRSTQLFPMAGRLRLWVMNPEEFEQVMRGDGIAGLRGQPLRYVFDTGNYARRVLGAEPEPPHA